MNFKFLPVVFTAFATSLGTLYVANHFNWGTRYIPLGAKPQQSNAMARYAGYDGINGALPASNFEMAAAASIRSVVHIKTTTQARTVVSNDMGDIFAQMFGPRQYIIPSQVESGSGVVISNDGYIVTNNHVIANGGQVSVTFNDKLTAQAKVVSTDPSTDIALLKVDLNELPYMEFGNSDEVKIGQWVLAAGYPLSLDATVTAGIVSAKGRSLGINNKQSASAIESFIQTDAAVNPGNSGGALVNTAGQLIGINAAIASPTGSYAGYSYAIPSNIVRKVINDMLKYGSVQRAYLGINYIDSKSASPEQIKALGLDKQDGIYVEGVLANSGAEHSGIKKGDFILAINGQPVNNKPQMQEQIARYQPGDNISVTYARNGTSKTVTVQLMNRNGTTDIIKAEQPLRFLGGKIRPLTDKEHALYNIDGGVVVTDIGNGTLARQTQMKAGFVITGVNNQPVHSVEELQQLLSVGGNFQIAGIQPGYPGMYYFVLNNITQTSE